MESMRSMKLLLLAAILGLLSTNAHAELTIIGTANYLGKSYNLVWDNDNNGKSIVWLDYTADNTQWEEQAAWAAGLNSPYILTYNIFDRYQVTWDGDWRLPDVGDNPGQGSSGAGMGTDQKTSEIGHLYFVEIGLSSYRTYTSYEVNYYSGAFENLVAHDYWYRNEFEGDSRFVWHFNMAGGAQNAGWGTGWGYGLAVREASIEVVSDAPIEPPAIDTTKAPNAHTELTTIGKANYLGAEYKLIWENDNNGNSIIWLDYTRGLDSWADQLSWAAGLNAEGVLTYTIYDEYSVNWEGDWRLPSVGNNPRREIYRATTSELGHLFQVELGLDFITHGDGYEPYKKAELYAAGEFDHLVPSKYWYAESSTDFPSFAWCFDMSIGYQEVDRINPSQEHGLIWENSAIAVRNARVLNISAVDSDGDHIADYRDNCSQTSNGNQYDTDGDGYGNMCDCDIDGEDGGDGSVNMSDYMVFRAAYGGRGPERIPGESGENDTYTDPSANWNANADFNGDNVVDLQDYQIFRSRYGSAAPFK
jgi:hypothetical protein